MKTYMPLNGLRWSRNSGSANCDMPQSVVFGRPGGVKADAVPVEAPQKANSMPTVLNRSNIVLNLN